MPGEEAEGGSGDEGRPEGARRHNGKASRRVQGEGRAGQITTEEPQAATPAKVLPPGELPLLPSPCPWIDAIQPLPVRTRSQDRATRECWLRGLTSCAVCRAHCGGAAAAQQESGGGWLAAGGVRREECESGGAARARRRVCQGRLSRLAPCTCEGWCARVRRGVFRTQGACLSNHPLLRRSPSFSVHAHLPPRTLTVALLPGAEAECQGCSRAQSRPSCAQSPRECAGGTAQRTWIAGAHEFRFSRGEGRSSYGDVLGAA